MSSDKNEKILDKIKKCLALGGSSNPHEAETALRQARKLMDANKLELGDVHASLAAESRLAIGRRPSAWSLSLGVVCASAFNCEVITSKDYHGAVILVFIGTDSSPELSKYSYDVLLRQLKAARKEYVVSLARCKLSTKRRRGDIFANSWINAVRKIVASFANIDELSQQAIEAYKLAKYPSLVSTVLKTKKITTQDRSAVYAGYDSGENAKLHRPMGRDPIAALTLF